MSALFVDSFVVEKCLKDNETKTMAEMWIDSKDNQEVVNAIVDEELGRIKIKNIYCYEIKEEVEKVARDVVKQMYAHLQYMEAMDFPESYIAVNKNEASDAIIYWRLNQSRHNI